MDNIDLWDIRRCWGNFSFEYDYSEAVGMSGGILCIWDDTIFQKKNRIVSDNFVIVSGVWIPSGKNLLVISVYAPQDLRDKKLLWDYLCSQICSWEGDVITMGDFNEVRTSSERFGSNFNQVGAKLFNEFIAKRRRITLKREQQQLDYIVIDKGMRAVLMKFNAMQDVVGRGIGKRCFQEKVKTASLDCGVEKCPPGPDGFTVTSGFYRQVIDLITQRVNSHLIFNADDAIFMGQWKSSNIENITRVLDIFHKASGLRINMAKSKLLGVSVDHNRVDQAGAKQALQQMKEFEEGEILQWHKDIKTKENKLGWGMYSTTFSRRTVGGIGSFKDIYPRLYMLENMKEVTVAHKLAQEDLEWSFRRKVRSGCEMQQLNSLKAKIEGVILNNSSDRWTWSLEGSAGEFHRVFISSERK
ncbi:RNA-directed DNA polymerase, eukaryota [Tanacetum coccineum]